MPKVTSGRTSRRIGLVGCVKKKASGPRKARELYVSPLFLARIKYVEKTCDKWWILSAKHDLVHPDDLLRPYEKTLKQVSRAERRDWSARILNAIKSRVRPSPGDVFEIHAGADYRDFGLVEGLRKQGLSVDIPTAGLSIGEQMRYYRTREGKGA